MTRHLPNSNQPVILLVVLAAEDVHQLGPLPAHQAQPVLDKKSLLQDDFIVSILFSLTWSPTLPMYSYLWLSQAMVSGLAARWYRRPALILSRSSSTTPVLRPWYRPAPPMWLSGCFFYTIDI